MGWWVYALLYGFTFFCLLLVWWGIWSIKQERKALEEKRRKKREAKQQESPSDE